HVHAPGTALGDGLGGDWEGYFRKIADATPPVVALGVTDYLSLDTYADFRDRWNSTETPHLKLVFPNVQFRLTPQGTKGSAINAHLLVSPEDPEHVALAREALSRLTIPGANEVIACSRT